jgi:hypothetical protein
VLTPVTELLNAVLKADDGQLTPDQATKLGDAVKAAIAQAAAAAPTPPSPKSGAKARAAADLSADALAGLQKAVDALLKAGTSGDAGQVVPAATNVATSLVNWVSSRRHEPPARAAPRGACRGEPGQGAVAAAGCPFGGRRL